MARQRGFTLVEVLVAMGILGLLLTVAYAGVIRGAQVQSDQEAITTAQARLRRVVEVFTQDVRSAVFGAITDHPYASGTTSISFALLDGAAGYPLLDQPGNSFPNAANSRVIAASSPDLLGQVLVVNAAGQAVILDVRNIQRVGGPDSSEWLVVHPGCGKNIDFTPNTLMFRVVTQGYRHDPASNTLFARAGSAPEAPLAWNITAFSIEYVYQNAGGDVAVNPQPPAFNASFPTREVIQTADGARFTLTRIQLVLASQEESRGRTFTRTYSGQVELPSGQVFTVSEVVPCR